MKYLGTIALGIKAPIIKLGDDLVEVVIDAIKNASKEYGFKIEDRDIICLTEAIVAKAEGNYATLEQIAKSIKAQFDGDTIGIVMPIFSRNRFGLLLEAFKMAFPNIILQLNYPFDEVGNPLVSQDTFDESGINPYLNNFSKQEFRKIFPKTIHPFTGIDYLEYYQEIIGPNNKIILSNNPQTILQYTNQVLVACVHNREKTKKILESDISTKVIGLDDILTEPIDGSGFHDKYGLLGSNKATPNKVKLFPRDGKRLIEEIRQKIFDEFQKEVEVMVYGDGAFKDPIAGIWELADPEVAPFYSPGLEGTPNEVKLKYLADSLLEKDINVDSSIKDLIKSKKHTSNNSLGTTPRRYLDLIGSLADLISGSGDKGTPIVYIKGYFDNYAS